MQILNQEIVFPISTRSGFIPRALARGRTIPGIAYSREQRTGTGGVGVTNDQDFELFSKGQIDPNSIAYINGRFVPLHAATVNIATNALQYGTASLEGINAYWNQNDQELYVFRLLDHYERLLKHCELLDLELTQTAEELSSITVELLQRNNSRQDVYIRPLAYKAGLVAGPTLLNKDGENPTGFCIHVRPLPQIDIKKGIRACIPSWQKALWSTMPANCKITGTYFVSTLAQKEAKDRGFDEAIFLTPNGKVSEATSTNVFVVHNRRLITPPVETNILKGITRDSIIELAASELHIEREVKEFGVEELYNADEIFLTGTLSGVRPVTVIDEHITGNGEIGPITKELQELYLEVARGNNQRYKNWCIPVFK